MKDKIKGIAGFLSVLVIVSLMGSLLYSFRSFSGYVVNETINSTGNWIALILFIMGVVGAYFLFKRI